MMPCMDAINEHGMMQVNPSGVFRMVRTLSSNIIKFKHNRMGSRAYQGLELRDADRLREFLHVDAENSSL